MEPTCGLHAGTSSSPTRPKLQLRAAAAVRTCCTGSSSGQCGAASRNAVSTVPAPCATTARQLPKLIGHCEASYSFRHNCRLHDEPTTMNGQSALAYSSTTLSSRRLSRSHQLARGNVDHHSILRCVDACTRGSMAQLRRESRTSARQRRFISSHQQCHAPENTARFPISKQDAVTRPHRYSSVKCDNSSTAQQAPRVDGRPGGENTHPFDQILSASLSPKQRMRPTIDRISANAEGRGLQNGQTSRKKLHSCTFR